MARRFMEFNVMFGVGGTVTFKNNKKVQEVIKELDMKYILLETDSPYLTPEPFRGMKNEPARVEIVAEKIASIKEITKEEVINTTCINAISQFDLTNILWYNFFSTDAYFIYEKYMSMLRGIIYVRGG